MKLIGWLFHWFVNQHVHVWKALPAQQLPEVFGMHDNVDISKELQETRLLFDNVLLTQGRSEGHGSGKSDDVLYQVANNILVKVLNLDCSIVIFSKDRPASRYVYISLALLLLGVPLLCITMVCLFPSSQRVQMQFPIFLGCPLSVHACVCTDVWKILQSACMNSWSPRAQRVNFALFDAHSRKYMRGLW